MELKPSGTSLQARGAKETDFSYRCLGFSDAPSVALQASDPMGADVQPESFTDLKQPLPLTAGSPEGTGIESRDLFT